MCCSFILVSCIVLIIGKMFYENTVYKIVFKAHNDFEVPLYFLLSFIAILAQEKIVAWYWNSGGRAKE